MSVLKLHGVAGTMTRRLAGVVIGTQGLAVFFGALVARALAAAEGSPTSGTFLLIGSLLAVLCILDAAMMRRPWGLTMGWVLQVVTLACALVVPSMLVVGLLFGALWVTALVQGHLMDEHTRVVDQRVADERMAAASGGSAAGGSQPGGSSTGGSATEGAEPEPAEPEPAEPERAEPERAEPERAEPEGPAPLASTQGG